MMSSFAEFAIETHHSMAELRWNTSAQDVSASFTVGSVNVRVTFELIDGYWRVLFEADRAIAAEQLTDVLAIFNGVFQASEEFIEVREPDALVFVSKRPELTGIYGKYLKREELQLKKLGYELSSVEASPYTEFWLKRTVRSRWVPLT
jgi:hypothetical protein